MIAIIGANGRLGHAVTEQLLSAGHPVTAVVRRAAKADDLRRLGAEVREADVTDAASIARAMRGVTQVVSAVHAILGRGSNRSEHVDDAGHRTLVDEARRAGVEHFVYLSALAASASHPVDFWRTKHRIEQYVAASGLPYTVVRAGAFMEMHAHELIGKSILGGRTATILGSGTGRVNYVAVRDVASVVVHALHDPAARGLIVDVGGPQNLTARDIVKTYVVQSGRDAKVRYVGAGALRVIGAVLRPLHPGVSRVMVASAATDGLDDAFVPTPAHARYPITLMTMDEFVREQVGRIPGAGSGGSHADPGLPH